jgi:transposase
MSYQKASIGAIPEETARIARAAFPKGNPYMRMRDELGVLFGEVDFWVLYSRLGQPGLAAWQLMLVTVMQYSEAMSDRQAAEAVRGRIDWKYALGLALDDAGFDFSVLSEWRDRLLEGDGADYLLAQLLSHFEKLGLVKSYAQQRTDATHVLAVVRKLNQLELVGETLRASLNALAVVAPDWLRAQVEVGWYERYALRVDDWRLPRSQSKRDALGSQIGQDGRSLLSAIYAPLAPSFLRQIPAVRILRQVWLQQFVTIQDQVCLREEKNQPPAHLKINSPYETEARHAKKNELTWLGYKAHVTETCAEAEVHLITHIETTPATVLDHASTPSIQQALARHDRLPDQHLVDAGYIDADVLLDSQLTYGLELVGPVPPDRSWQAKAGQGFALTNFQVDWSAQQAICPQGQHSSQWAPGQDAFGNPVIRVRFSDKTCRACPVRVLCTRDSSRGLTLRPQPVHDSLQAARIHENTEAFQTLYKRRAGIEATLSQATRTLALRDARYRGLAKTHLQHVFTAIAINLRRILAWLDQPAYLPRKPSPFARLAT